jgi:hypothetical protein
MIWVPLSHALAQPRQQRLAKRGRPVVSIYALVDPFDSGVRYVGQTSSHLETRLDRHLACPTNPMMRQWFSELATDGFRPRIVELEQVREFEWEDAERGWICWFRQRGELINVDPGGEYRTPDGRPRKVTLGEFLPPRPSALTVPGRPGALTAELWEKIKRVRKRAIKKEKRERRRANRRPP